ncbi:unnamed protein product [Rotaria socialis]|uniref:DUF202 domain-containing protein n=1 Tax=Rotaria socialis TaxID=392032 RepID=A0A817VH16_9BILA|nr:unnamed protein product [Rotaria socialis]CAF3384779.1 unnamed protein product [Rotaria socialis]CAF3458878.1 unnamed protein product [Rotaria socialis]CAF3762314.1 unnamed protein product [Rotaria socialis]CAF4292846.1 unnamed protein product [Rotaria socialis]
MEMVESSPLVDPLVVKTSPEPAANKFQGSFTDHLANERTFLAWIRTGLGIFAFGCAIARFGGANDVQKTFKDSFHEIKPIISGLLLAFAGVILLFFSIYRFCRVNRQIMHRDLTAASQIREPLIAALALILCLTAILIIFVVL